MQASLEFTAILWALGMAEFQVVPSYKRTMNAIMQLYNLPLLSSGTCVSGKEISGMPKLNKWKRV